MPPTGPSKFSAMVSSPPRSRRTSPTARNTRTPSPTSFPKYLAELPGDVFSAKAMIYKPTAAGYLLYSVGVNGKDDGGQLISEEPRGDDLRVRIPRK